MILLWKAFMARNFSLAKIPLVNRLPWVKRHGAKWDEKILDKIRKAGA